MFVDENEKTFYQELIIYDPNGSLSDGEEDDNDEIEDIIENEDKDHDVPIPPSYQVPYIKTTWRKEPHLRVTEIRWVREMRNDYGFDRRYELLLSWYPLENSFSVREIRSSDRTTPDQLIGDFAKLIFRKVPHLKS